jgi:hypothetical protein
MPKGVLRSRPEASKPAGILAFDLVSSLFFNKSLFGFGQNSALARDSMIVWIALFDRVYKVAVNALVASRSGGRFGCQRDCICHEKQLAICVR